MEDKENKKRLRRRVVGIIILLLTIHLILILIKIPVLRESFLMQYVTYEYIENYTYFNNFTEQKCMNEPFRWEYRWEGWNPLNSDYVSPIYRLVNLEDAAGAFSVEFAFFDESLYRYSDYEGIEYALVSDKLPWGAASMHSPVVLYNLTGKEERIISVSVKKADRTKSYWVYAHVVPPDNIECLDIPSDYIEARSRNYTMRSSENIRANITSRITLWDFLINKFINQ